MNEEYAIPDAVPDGRTILRPSLLFVVEDPADLAYLRDTFRREPLHLYFCPSVKQGLSVLAENRIDLIVADVLDDWGKMIGFLEKAKEIRQEAMRILVGPSANEPQAMESVAKGLAQRYLVKPWNNDRLKELVVESVHMRHEERLYHLQLKLNSFTSLPSPERFQSRLQQLLNKRDSSLYSLVDEIEKSPALIAKMLQVANSVQYWTRVPISTIREAVVFIGTANIASLVAAIEIFENITHGVRPDIRAHYELLWERSLRRANIAKKIAEEWSEAGQPHVAYVAAMLQDVGLLVRICNEHKRYLEMITIARNERRSHYSAELAVFTNTHDELGAILLQLWNFPREIIFAIAHHHGRSFDDPLTQVIQIADALYANDLSNPHDEAIDPMTELWRARLESASGGDILAPLKHQAG